MHLLADLTSQCSKPKFFSWS